MTKRTKREDTDSMEVWIKDDDGNLERTFMVGSKKMIDQMKSAQKLFEALVKQGVDKATAQAFIVNADSEEQMKH